MYPETILILSKQIPNVRSIDISEYMGYSKPSVSRAVGLLKSGSYISVDSDGYISLTGSGGSIAEKIFARHTILSQLLIGRAAKYANLSMEYVRGGYSSINGQMISAPASYGCRQVHSFRECCRILQHSLVFLIPVSVHFRSSRNCRNIRSNARSRQRHRGSRCTSRRAFSICRCTAPRRPESAPELQQ